MANLLELTHWNFVLETENLTQVLESDLVTEAYKLTSVPQQGSESGLLELTAVLRHNLGSCPHRGLYYNWFWCWFRSLMG